MKIKLFKKEKSFKKEKESMWLNINLYWKLVVSLIFLTVLLSLGYGYYLFTQINKELVVVPGTTSGRTETVKKVRIDKILEYFFERDQKSAEILSAPSPVIDPSL